MIGLGRVSIGAMALVMLGTSPAFAQGQDEHSGHHPAGAPAATSQPSTPPPAQPGAMKGGMGGQNMPMEGMKDGMPMCGMMGGGMMGGGMNMGAHIEQRLVAIRSELAITSAQARSWDAYANALRAAAANMDKMHGAMMAGHQGKAMSPIERLDHHDRMLAAMRDNLRTLRPALERLYAGLSAEQKRKADTLLTPQGMMMQQKPMMGGMMRR